MTSSAPTKEGYVWIWLPGKVQPVVAGKLTLAGSKILFNYGQSYLERENAIPIDPKELPLKAGVQKNKSAEALHGCLRDAAPDAWGRRVILNKLLGRKGKNADTADLGEMAYLMESGSDRIGALDFQASPTDYVPRLSGNAPLETLLHSAELVEKGVPLSEELAQALHHGTSIGGARPKAMLEADDKKYIAKFSSSTDVYNVIKAEFMAMRLAKHCGLKVADVRLETVSGKDVLLIERFDRQRSSAGWARKLMLSALTLLELDEMGARYASYQDLAEIIRHRFADPQKTLEQLFARLVFNILCSNNDDHARNHAAFWDGKALKLTPAYDICPQLRSGEEATQAMLIEGDNRSSRLATALAGARHFLLDEKKAREIIDNQIKTIHSKWDDVAQEASLTDIEYTLFKERLFLRPYAFEGYSES
ncbi:MAG TPA: type II toxin-antitoxin system HipA family toxin [Alphaproteobacteria bacterium]|nr:type II toxin-antitoxin system HipA family toxin [Alphaproteobacteria bacterium]USO06761.1 MAG: type II toxin-antitoxin system HipA family toxin [Rhodospirillales bacterium]HOO82581.1 type II toxin-antitoxin system HipA family toxin [Alphaproteobacteria bacterium]